MSRLDIAPKHWKIVKAILARYPHDFYVFGSRAKQVARQYSDLDLYYKESIPDAVISRIEGEFEESDLPFKVELINWNQCSADFQQEIEKDAVLCKLVEDL